MKWFVIFSVMLAGHIPALSTALFTEDYLHFMDYMSIFAGWSFGMLILELWNQHELKKEFETKIKS